MRVVIVNPASASGRTAKRWQRIVAELERSGAALDVQLTERCGHAIELTRAAVAAGARSIVVLGGDGTLGEVVAGCIAPDGLAPLADDIEISLIHQGTGGDLARGLGLPKDEAGAIEVALHGTPRRIDVGVAAFTPRSGLTPVADAAADGSLLRGFVSTSNVGIGAEVVERASGRLKRFGRSASFAVATVACLARNQRRSIDLSLSASTGNSIDVVGVDVCNNAWMGGGMHAAPDAQLDDGQFDVVVISAARRAKLLRTFPKIYSGQHVHDPLVTVHRVADLRIDVAAGGSPQGVVLDGELVGETPVAYRVLPRAVGFRVAVATDTAVRSGGRGAST